MFFGEDEWDNYGSFFALFVRQMTKPAKGSNGQIFLRLGYPHKIVRIHNGMCIEE